LGKVLFISVCLFSMLMSSTPLMAKEYNFVTLDFSPLEYKGEDGKIKGVATEIVTKIMANLGHTVNVEVYHWEKALNMVELGKADAIFTIYKNDERVKFLDYSKEVLVPQIISFYVRKGSSITYDGDLSKLSEKKIGVVSTISYGKKFDDFRDKLKIERVENRKNNFKKLQAGQIDLVISSLYIADSLLEKMGSKDDFVRLSHNVQSIPSYIAFSKKLGLTTLRDQFDVELQKLIDSGEYAELMKKYGIDI
ncbi:MAG: transporter substrate-binding domain-containing protein, partial [Campylobacterota bacterium]|nr:transporter substrate-binding domain-containing protein [Campylobacterota bacterium]